LKSKQIHKLKKWDEMENIWKIVLIIFVCFRDGEDYIFFNDVLFACMKKEYGQKLMQNAGPVTKMLNKLEVETRLKIAEKKKK